MHCMSSVVIVLDCLRSRYSNESIYTNAGSVVVAVNPFKDIPALYSTQRIRSVHEGAHQEVSARSVLGFFCDY